jgi:hypothetical protein
MTTRLAAWTAIAIASATLPDIVRLACGLDIAVAASEVYIQQARGRVAPGATIQTKPTPETTTATTTVAPAAASTAPVTCNAQNASSQACYTATQQARPVGR